MARVTVEDCVDKVPNRFELVLLAAHRARLVSGGAPLTIDRDNDKNPVVALREIADRTVIPGDLKEDFIHSLQKNVEVDEPEGGTVPTLSSSQPQETQVPDRETQDVADGFEQMGEEELLKNLEGLAAQSKERNEF